jgi:two-component system, chemotaxis family, protein-glutamate methylesterase/glutaminase
MSYEAVVIGVSTGGMKALPKIIPELPKAYSLPVMIVQHHLHDADEFLAGYLNSLCDILVKSAESREVIKAQCVYIAPSGYHLQVERHKSLSLSVDPKVKHSIPSIDVLFETAAHAYQDKLVGVILTGASSDGCQGLETIKKYGGLAIVQDPDTAQSPYMPRVAIDCVDIDHIIPLDEMGVFLRTLAT